SPARPKRSNAEAENIAPKNQWRSIPATRAHPASNPDQPQIQKALPRCAPLKPDRAENPNAFAVLLGPVMAKFQSCPARRANIDSPTHGEGDPPHRRLCAKSGRDNIACRVAARGAADIYRCPDIR